MSALTLDVDGTPVAARLDACRFPGAAANALVPENDQVAVGAQRRAGDQSELTIGYVMGPAPVIPRTVWLFASLAAATGLLALVMRTSPAP